MVRRLLESGFTVQGFEAGADVGGTWYWNRYPGARCDVPSLEYSYRFSEDLQQEWEWSERYAPQPELLRYANHVADRFDLRPYFRFNARVVRCAWDDTASVWTVETADGVRETARWLVSAVGLLSVPSRPDFPGVSDFAGPIYLTGAWPHEGVDFTGKRVGVVGTGSSGVQVIPAVAKEAAHLTVFQRTASYVVPAHNRPADPEETAAVKRGYRAFRDYCGTQLGAMNLKPGPKPSALELDDEARRARFEEGWATGGFSFQGAFSDLTTDLAANDTASAFFRDKIAAIVHDPETVKKLIPPHRFGVRRLCIGTDYYETYNRPNVTLVDIRSDPIERITASGVRTASGDHPLDALIFATGFDAITGPLFALGITGQRGRALKDAWSEGARTYLGMAVAGFPNLLVMSGPGGPAVLTNVLYSLEQNVDWAARFLTHQRDAGRPRFSVSLPIQDAYSDLVTRMGAATLMATGESWYTGANIPGKTRQFLVHVHYPKYVSQCDEEEVAGYPNFAAE
jgi:cyclohexanone monooxygenase